VAQVRFVRVQLDALLKRHVPDTELLSRAGGEIAYRLPKGDASKCAPLRMCPSQLENP